MALENTVAKYEINVTQTGAGAADAVGDFKKVQSVAAETNKAFEGLNITARNSGLAFRSMRTAMEFVGLNTLPQMTLGAMAAREGWEALEKSGATGAAQLAKTAAVTIIGVTALYELVSAIESAGDQFRTLQAAQASLAQDNGLIDKLRGDMTAMHDAGKITNEEFEQLQKTLAKPEQINLTDVQTLMNKVGGATKEEAAAFEESANKTKASIEAVTDALKKLRAVSPQQQLGDLGALQGNQNARAANAAGNRDGIYSNADKEADYVRVLEQESAQLKLIRDLQAQGEITAADAARLKLQASTKQIQAVTAINAQLTQTQQIEKQAAQSFSSGLAGAIVEFASGAKTAKAAFEDFARTFLEEIAKMILQTIILNTIKSAFGGIGGSFGTSMKGAAGGLYGGGAQLMAAGGMAVSSPTYFPRFNVVAGEAGMEFISVLSKPRFMDVGGISAVVGNMGGRRIAMTDANELQNGGRAGGGQLHVKVTMDEGLRGEIVSSSIKGAVHEVTNNMGQNSKLARVTRQVTRSS